MSSLSEKDLLGNYQVYESFGSDGTARIIDQPGCSSLLLVPELQSSQVEEESIQINVNRESLKRKLLLRRTLPELVDQGIYPPLNVPPAFADRQRHLQRAQTGDRLRQKLKERPDRECLVQHHILEDTSVLVDRSLQDKQRLLKRSRLQSDLSGRLASRPGPLELVTKNILQTDPQLKDGLIEGKIPFTRTTEVDDPVRRLYHPDLYQVDDDDFGVQSSNPIDFSALVSDDSLPDSICRTPTERSAEQIAVASNSVPSPPDSFSIMSPKPSTEPNIPPAPDITPLLRGEKFHLINPQLPPAPVFNFAPSLQPTVLQSSGTIQASSGGDMTFSDGSLSSVGSSSKRVTKKSKNKNVTKSKIIKFHEYKGPPSAVRTNSKVRTESPREPPASTSTAYGVLLQQQQLFLQWQLEFQQQTLLSRQQSESTQLAAANTIAAPATAHMSLSSSAPSDAVQPAAVVTSGVFNFKPLSAAAVAAPAAMKSPLRLEDMRVADLKSECKRLSLPSHGSKPQLVERLTPHLNKITISSGQTRESMISFRNSDSSLSGSSEVASPVATSLDLSFTGNQFGILSGQKAVVPVPMEIAPTRPSSILPMDVDQSAGQSPGGFICPAPATFILVQAGPQLSQASQQLSQIPCNDVARKDQNRPQIFGITRPSLAPSNSFDSSQVGNAAVTQPLMLLTHPIGASRAIKTEEQRTPLPVKPTPQSMQQVPCTGRPRSESISSEELVIRQQQVIATLEHSLQEYQKKLLWTEQKALLQQIQLSSLAQDPSTASSASAVERKNSTNAKNAFDGKGHMATVTLSSDNGICNQALFTQSRMPYELKTNGNSATLKFGNPVSAYKQIVHSATEPVLQTAPSKSSHRTDSYPILSDVVSESLTRPLLSSQCNTLDDIIDVLCKKGELMLPINDDDIIASDAKESSATSGDINPMFTLSNGSDLISGHRVDGGSTVDGAFLFDSRLLAASLSNSFPAQSAGDNNDAKKTDLCLSKPGATYVNGSLDAADAGLFAFGDMEWSDLDLNLDLMSSQMDIGQNDTCGVDKNFDLDVSDVEWLSRNGDVLPAVTASAGPSQGVAVVASSAAPHVGCDYLPLLQPGEELDFFSYEDHDPFGTSDLSTMMNFETFVDAQTSKT